jgi:hypothetical protein
MIVTNINYNNKLTPNYNNHQLQQWTNIRTEYEYAYLYYALMRP